MLGYRSAFPCAFRAREPLHIALSVITALAGCGFHLRGEATYTFQTIFVNAPGAPTLAAELSRALAATGSARSSPTPRTPR